MAIRKRQGKRGPSYQVSVDLGPGPNGERRRHTSTHRTRKQAEAEERRVRDAHAGGTYVPPSKVTLGEFLDRWLAAQHQLEPTTRLRYEGIVRLALKPALGHVRLADLRAAHIVAAETAWLTAPRSAHNPRPLARSTVREVHAVLRRALRQARSWGELSANPMDLVQAPAPARSPAAILDTDQLARALVAIEAHPYRVPLLLLIYGGLRVGEVLGLRWGDLDWETGAARVRQKWSPATHAFGPTKTHRSMRPIDLDAGTFAVLRRHRAEQRRVREAAPLWEEHDLVVSDGLGRPLGYWGLWRAFKALMGGLGLPPTLRPHDLRHTHASHLLAAGVPVKVVQERLGHADAALTLNTYGHVIPGQQKAAAELFAARFRPQDGNMTPSDAEDGAQGAVLNSESGAPGRVQRYA